MKTKTLALAALLALPAGTMHAEGLFKKVYGIVAAALLMTIPEAQAEVAGQLIPKSNLRCAHNSYSHTLQNHEINAYEANEILSKTLGKIPHYTKDDNSHNEAITTTEVHPECHRYENGVVECCRNKIIHEKHWYFEDRFRHKKLCVTMQEHPTPTQCTLWGWLCGGGNVLSEFIENYKGNCLLQALDDPDFADVIAYFNDEDE